MNNTPASGATMTTARDGPVTVPSPSGREDKVIEVCRSEKRNKSRTIEKRSPARSRQASDHEHDVLQAVSGQ
jgi:hypothetical protein